MYIFKKLEFNKSELFADVHGPPLAGLWRALVSILCIYISSYLLICVPLLVHSNSHTSRSPQQEHMNNVAARRSKQMTRLRSTSRSKKIAHHAFGDIKCIKYTKISNTQNMNYGKLIYNR